MPEDRGLIELTVEENILLLSWTLKQLGNERLSLVYKIMPELKKCLIESIITIWR